MRLFLIALCLSIALGKQERSVKISGVPLNKIILAIIQVESKGNPFATRYEPHLIKKYKWHKSWGYSYGLMQVVFGFHYKTCNLASPGELFNPLKNIECGSKIFLSCHSRYRSLRGALNCYNGDKSGRYARKVERILNARTLS